jgi:hypothetical protein
LALKGEYPTIFGLLDRNYSMYKFSQIGSSFLIAIFLLFSANASSCIALHEIGSDSPSESHRDCPKDDFSVRTPNFAQSRITHQQQHGNRHLDIPFNAAITNATPLKCLRKRAPSPARRILNTVLRI